MAAADANLAALYAACQQKHAAAVEAYEAAVDLMASAAKKDKDH